jgi:hypothetical protein
MEARQLRERIEHVESEIERYQLAIHVAAGACVTTGANAV